MEERENKKQSFIFLPGYGIKCGFDKMSLPWAKTFLSEKGCEVHTPNLPNQKFPNVSEWVSFLIENYNFDENTVLSVESFSGLVAFKILERLEKPINKLVLSGCFMEPVKKDRPYNSDIDWKFDFGKIKKNAKKIIVIADKNDDTVPLHLTKKVAETLGVDLRIISAEKPHFRGEKEQERLDICLNS